MSPVLRITLLIGIVFYAGFILYMLKSKKLSLKYSLLWLFSALFLLILDVFPSILYTISDLIGVKSPVNTIFTILIFFVLLLLIALTSIVSKQTAKIKTLIQTVSILQKEVDELKENK